MSYPQRVHESAFELWLKDCSVEEIAKYLRRSDPRCAGLAAKTVDTWRHRYQWRNRRAAIERRSQAKLDETRGDFLAEALAGLVGIRQRLTKFCQTQSSPHSLEGAIKSLTNVIRLERSLRGLDRQPAGNLRIDSVQVAAIGDQVLALLERHPVIRPILERHRGEILRQLTEGGDTHRRDAENAEKREEGHG